MATVMAGGNGMGTLPQATRRDFSGVGYDEAMSASGLASQTSCCVSGS